MKGDMNMKIKAEWVTNNFNNLEMALDCAGRDGEFVKIVYDEISNQFAELMSRGEIKHFLLSIER